MENVRIIDSKKFMWDGEIYITKAEIKKMDQCQEHNSEVVHLNREEKHLLYTGRVVTEIVLDEGGHST